MLKLLPKETRDHLRAARREKLLALRSLIDACVEKIDARSRTLAGGEKDTPRHSETEGEERAGEI